MKLSTQDLLKQLENRYLGDEWAFFSEVPDGTGSAQTRTADGLAMSLWPSRGLELIGFEIKRSRGDWLKELKTPRKAESIGRFCNRWYIVAPKDLVHPNELPPRWGLLESTGKSLRIKVKSPEYTTPDPIDKAFLAGILRKASREPERIRQEGHNEGYTKGLGDGRKWNDEDVDIARKEVKDIESRINQFEKASGIRICKWSDNTKIGSAVHAVINARDTRMVQIDQMIRSNEKSLGQLKAAKDEIQKLGKVC